MLITKFSFFVRAGPVNVTSALGILDSKGNTLANSKQPWRILGIDVGHSDGSRVKNLIPCLKTRFFVSRPIGTIVDNPPTKFGALK